MKEMLLVTLEQSDCNNESSPCHRNDSCPLEIDAYAKARVPAFTSYFDSSCTVDIIIPKEIDLNCIWCLIRDMICQDIPIDIIHVGKWYDIAPSRRRPISFLIKPEIVDKVVSAISLWKLKNNNSKVMVSGFAILSSRKTLHNDLEHSLYNFKTIYDELIRRRANEKVS